MYYEFLVNPAYTILFSHSDHALYSQVSEQVLASKSVYNIYFGSAFCIAEYDGQPREVETELKYVENGSVVSVLDTHTAKDGLCLVNNLRYLSDNIPFIKDSDLTVKSFKQVIYQPEGKPLTCTGMFYSINDTDYVHML